MKCALKCYDEGSTKCTSISVSNNGICAVGYKTLFS